MLAPEYDPLAFQQTEARSPVSPTNFSLELCHETQLFPHWSLRLLFQGLALPKPRGKERWRHKDAKKKKKKIWIVRSCSVACLCLLPFGHSPWSNHTTNQPATIMSKHQNKRTAFLISLGLHFWRCLSHVRLVLNNRHAFLSLVRLLHLNQELRGKQSPLSNNTTQALPCCGDTSKES